MIGGEPRSTVLQLSLREAWGNELRDSGDRHVRILGIININKPTYNPSDIVLLAD